MSDWKATVTRRGRWRYEIVIHHEHLHDWCTYSVYGRERADRIARRDIARRNLGSQRALDSWAIDDIPRRDLPPVAAPRQARSNQGSTD